MKSLSLSVAFCLVLNIFISQGFAQGLRNNVSSKIVVKSLSVISSNGKEASEEKPETDDTTKSKKAQNKESNTENEKKTKVKLWAGYNWYKMDTFNDKLEHEKNKGIDGGFAGGLELTHQKLSKEIPIIGQVSLTLPILGIEYLNASSETTHTFFTSEGKSFFVTAKWELPVLGVYIAPELNLYKQDSIQMYFRPIGIGYYRLGELFKAKLTVSDRPGSLEFSGDSFGFLSQLGIKYVFEEKDEKNDFGYELFTEVGYRYLKFSDVSLKTNGDFTETYNGHPVKAGVLTESLDYSGFILKGGVSFKF